MFWSHTHTTDATMNSRREARLEAEDGYYHSQVRRRQSPAAGSTKDPWQRSSRTSLQRPPDPPEQGDALGTRGPRNGRAKSGTALDAPPQRRRERAVAPHDCASIPEAVASDDCVSKLSTLSVRDTDSFFSLFDDREPSLGEGGRSNSGDCVSKLSTLPVRNTSRSHGHARGSAARPKSPPTAAGPGRQSPTDRAPPAADDDAPCPSVGADAVVGVASGAAGPVVAAGDASPAVSPKAADRVASDASSAAAVSSAAAASSSTDPSDRSTGQLSMAGDRSMGDLLLGMGDLLFVLGKERPATRLFQCSTAAVKDGMRNSEFFNSTLLGSLESDFLGSQIQEDVDQTSRDKSEDSSAAAREGKAVPRRKLDPPSQVLEDDRVETQSAGEDDQTSFSC